MDACKKKHRFRVKIKHACKSKNPKFWQLPCKKNHACKTYRVKLGACKKNRQISVKKIGLAITFSIGLGLLREGELDCVGSGFGFTRKIFLHAFPIFFLHELADFFTRD